MQTTTTLRIHAEVDKLVRQSCLLTPVTSAALLRAGVRPGMRVLDVGCGTGDVALLAAELVGDAGSVFGVEGSAELVAVARRRAVQLDRRNMLFHVCQAEDVPPPFDFDAVIGNLALLHHEDPIATIHQITSYLSPHGLILWHEGSAP